jgi:hypothetical protein
VLGRVTGEEGRDVKGVVRSVINKDRKRGRRDCNACGINSVIAEGLKSRS